MGWDWIGLDWIEAERSHFLAHVVLCFSVYPPPATCLFLSGLFDCINEKRKRLAYLNQVLHLWEPVFTGICFFSFLSLSHSLIYLLAPYCLSMPS